MCIVLPSRLWRRIKLPQIPRPRFHVLQRDRQKMGAIELFCPSSLLPISGHLFNICTGLISNENFLRVVNFALLRHGVALRLKKLRGLLCMKNTSPLERERLIHDCLLVFKLYSIRSLHVSTVSCLSK